MKDYRSGSIKAEDIKDLPIAKIFEGLSSELKTIEKYVEIERAIIKIMFSDHEHKKIKEFVNCKRCKAKVQKKREYIKEQGFKDYSQYIQWKRVINTIKDHVYQILLSYI